MRSRLTCAVMVTALVSSWLSCQNVEEAPEETPSCGAAEFEIPEDFTGPLFLVSKTCEAGAAKGVTGVFADLPAAIDAASAQSAILIDAGTFKKPAFIDKALSLIGKGADVSILAPDAGDPGLTIQLTEGAEAGGTVSIRGVGIEGATGYGLLVSKGELVLEDVHVNGTTATAEGFGHGIQASDGAVLRLLDGTKVEGNAGVGVLVYEAAAVVGGTFIKGNGQGGIAVVGGTFVPKADGAGGEPSSIADCTIEDNGTFGVALFGSDAVLDGNVIAGTKTPAQGGAGGDGLLVVSPGPDEGRTASVTISGTNVIRGSGRAGAVFSEGGSAATVVPGTFLKVDMEGEIKDSALGGMWAQGAGVEVSVRAGGVLSDNHYFGASASAGARLVMDGCRVERTVAHVWAPPGGEHAPAEVGDGIVMSGGATLDAKDVNLIDNERAAITAENATDALAVVGGTFITGGVYGIAVQDLGAGLTEEQVKQMVTFEGTGEAIHIDPDLLLRTRPCDSSSSDACIPAQPAN